MFKGRGALVTGSTSGIGWGIARSLAENGCRVVLHGSREEDNEVRHKLQTLKSLSEAAGAPACTTGYLRADLSDPIACKNLVNSAIILLDGCLDFLINNAGCNFLAPVESFPEDKWDLILSVDLSAAFHTTKAALPGMYDRKFGRLIHIGSVMSTIGGPNKVAYAAAKHGLVGMSKVMALEGAPKGVTSNVICPAFVLTPLIVTQLEAQSKKEGISMDELKMNCQKAQPTGEFITPEAIGEMVVWLCNSKSSQVNGGSFVIDGGLTAQ